MMLYLEIVPDYSSIENNEDKKNTCGDTGGNKPPANHHQNID